MKKSEIIERYGEAAYERKLEQGRERYKAHKEEAKAYAKRYREEHPEEVIAIDHEKSRKGGKRYAKKLKDIQTGLQGARNRIRKKHAHQYRPYKQIIAPDSQLHHGWVPDTDEYRGVALVEKDAHMHGIVDVIEILDGKITLLTEEEVKVGKKKRKENDL